MAGGPRFCAAGNREGYAPAQLIANSLDLLDFLDMLDSHYLQNIQNIQKTNILGHKPLAISAANGG